MSIVKTDEKGRVYIFEFFNENKDMWNEVKKYISEEDHFNYCSVRFNWHLRYQYICTCCYKQFSIDVPADNVLRCTICGKDLCGNCHISNCYQLGMTLGSYTNHNPNSTFTLCCTCHGILLRRRSQASTKRMKCEILPEYPFPEVTDTDDDERSSDSEELWYYHPVVL